MRGVASFSIAVLARLRALSEPRQSTSLPGLMQSVHLLSQRTRGRLSRDAWRTLHDMAALFETSHPATADPLHKLDTLIVLLSALSAQGGR